MNNVLFRITLSIKFLKLWWLKSIGIVRLSILLVYGLDYEKKFWAVPPYWALMEFAIISWSSWTNNEAIEAKCCDWFSYTITFPLSFTTRVWLDSVTSRLSIWFLKEAISQSFPSIVLHANLSFYFCHSFLANACIIHHDIHHIKLRCLLGFLRRKSKFAKH